STDSMAPLSTSISRAEVDGTNAASRGTAAANVRSPVPSARTRCCNALRVGTSAFSLTISSLLGVVARIELSILVRLNIGTRLLATVRAHRPAESHGYETDTAEIFRITGASSTGCLLSGLRVIEPGTCGCFTARAAAE